MTTIQVCRTCLAHDTRMYTIANTALQLIYEKITNVTLDTQDGTSSVVCYICYHLLKKCHRFAESAIRANDMLQQISKSGIQITQQYIAQFEQKHIITFHETAVTLVDTAIQVSKDIEIPKVEEMSFEIKMENEQDEMAVDGTECLETNPVEYATHYGIKAEIEDTKYHHHHNSDSDDDAPLQSIIIKKENEDVGQESVEDKAGQRSKDMDLTPGFIREEAKTVVENHLPHKSKQRYLKSYEDFMKWRAEKKVESLSENVLLIYFNELSKTYKPSTLWSVYSMLKSTLSTKHNVHLKDFERLTSFLKRQSNGFKSKKSKVFTSQEVETFLNQAPDATYLVMKVVLVLGISGACRSIELVNMKVDDIEKQGDIILVKLRGTKTEVDRTFVIKKEYVKIIEKYQKLRPSGIETNRFFMNYHKGKCMRQVIGKNKISSIPKEIATYLNLPNSDLYSGHCFRRTSATLLADSGADLSVIKKHGGWKSSKVAKGYIEESVENKTKISHRVTEMINPHSTDSPQPSTSKDYPVQSNNIAVTAEKNRQISMSPSFTQESVDTEETQVSQKISNINIPGKNLSLTKASADKKRKKLGHYNCQPLFK